MFNSRFYDPQALIKIEQENKYKNRPELYLKRQIVTDQRQIIKQMIYMISGLETELFVKNFDQVQFDSEKGEAEKVFNYSLRENIRTVLTHLTYQSVKSCTQNPIKIANLIHYLTSKSRLVYEKTQNVILKSFSQGIMNFISRITILFSHILRGLQIQGGNLSSFKSVNLQYQDLTLLKTTYIFEQKALFISQLVNIMSKILPYMRSAADGSPTDGYLAIQILLDQFSRLMNSAQLSSNEKEQVLRIYQNSLFFYMKLIQNWIQMNPHLLQSQSNIPFFIKLSQTNFSLSKASLAQNVQHLKNKMYQTPSLRQQVHKSDQFIQLFFKLDNMLVEEYLPQMFKRQGQCILQLGKIIQFIYLYFSISQKPFLAEYFQVQRQFQQLFRLIKCSASRRSEDDSASSMFQSCDKRRERNSISDRLATTRSNNLKIIKIEQDNPYSMYANTRGAFLDHEMTFSTDNPTRTHDKQLFVQGRHPPLTPQNFNLKFQHLLSQVIERLYEKALFFFQSQSESQFFKVSSHLNFPFLSSNSHKIQTSYKALNLPQQTPTSLNMIEPITLSSNLCNNQRIISSIKLTLTGIKKFMLFEQGDFFIQLISFTSSLFQNSCTKVSRNLITSHIQQAIKSSSANSLPSDLKEKVSFIFIKKTKNQQIKQLKVWSVFSILFRPQFPVSCIFDSQIMQSFGEVFNFIFNIKKCQHLLKGIWNDFKENAKIQTQYSLFQTKKHPFEYKILAVRNNIHHFINVIFGFVMISIQTLWQEYIQQINLSFSSKMQTVNTNQAKANIKLHNPISLIELTHKLQNNLRLQTTQNLTLSNTMILISELLSKFLRLLRTQPDSKEWSQVIFRQQIEYIGHQFMGIMEMAKGIEGVGQAIFYNNQI